jgi:hypothetical protein
LSSCNLSSSPGSGIDSGPILAQVSSPVPVGADLAWAKHEAFLHKAELIRRLLAGITGLPRPLTAMALLERFGRSPLRVRTH